MIFGILLMEVTQVLMSMDKDIIGHVRSRSILMHKEEVHPRRNQPPIL